MKIAVFLLLRWKLEMERYFLLGVALTDRKQVFS